MRPMVSTQSSPIRIYRFRVLPPIIASDSLRTCLLWSHSLRVEWPDDCRKPSFTAIRSNSFSHCIQLLSDHATTSGQYRTKLFNTCQFTYLQYLQLLIIWIGRLKMWDHAESIDSSANIRIYQRIFIDSCHKRCERRLTDSYRLQLEYRVGSGLRSPLRHSLSVHNWRYTRIGIKVVNSVSDSACHLTDSDVLLLLIKCWPITTITMIMTWPWAWHDDSDRRVT